MTNKTQNYSELYNSTYFNRAAYAGVSFSPYGQYWWSNRFYAKLAQRYGPKEGRVLDVGCGMGHLLGWFSREYQPFGVDINYWALNQARKNVPNAQFIQLLAENLEIFPDSHFQIVVMKHIVEHLSNPQLTIQEICRVLKPGGLLLMATPNLDSPMRKLKKGDWIGYRDPTHISLKSPAEWIDMLRINQMVPLRVFSDGFWDAPYLPLLPKLLQKIIFGAPGGLQAILVWGIIPLWCGESMIVLAKKQ